jgi:flagellar biosynthesis/type III secretory pathway M-ring protein FliF/YscJ
LKVEEETGIEQKHDLFVARSLCHEDILKGEEWWDANIIIIIVFVVALIVLCALYELMRAKKNKDQADRDGESPTTELPTPAGTDRNMLDAEGQKRAGRNQD